MSNFAILVNSVGFNYNKNHPVLKDVNINVPKGKIYALLGSNGCGKTTLFKILLGRLRAQNGSVHIMGIKLKPSTRLNHLIGHMPQSIALNPGMSIEETFYYFARVNHITERQFVQDRIENYLKMLDLHDESQQVGQLSGGQKRLLSLGVTMICEPKILLLDEPTVGVDSLIRCNIWKHLSQICQAQETTVLITTHYTEEARQSDLVGFLREGHLLAEESPQNLMRHLECNSLEEVFYKLCINSNPFGLNDKIKFFRYFKEASEEAKGQIDLKSSSKIEIHQQKHCSNSTLNREHMQALAYREMLLFKSSLLQLFLMICAPVLTIFLFKFSIGSLPQHVPVALVNHDDALNNQSSVRLSDLYLTGFNNSMVEISAFRDEQSAFDSIKSGQNVIAIVFRKNFSSSFFSRYSSKILPFDEEDEDEEDFGLKRLLNDSSIHLYADMSRPVHVSFLNRSLFMAFEHLIRELGSMNGLNPYIFSPPIEIKQMYYGSMPELSFPQGIILCVLFTISVLMSALKILQIRANGCLERDLNQGIKPIEYLLTSKMVPLSTIFIQVLVALVFTFYIIHIQLEGNFWAAFLLVYLCTLQGIFIGTLISVLAKTQVAVLISTFSIMVIMFFTSGVMWPIEAMSSNVQKAVLLNPLTLPSRSLRNIMLRGWSIGNRTVYVGYLSCLLNCAVLFVVESILFHYYAI